MIDRSEKRNRRLASELQNSHVRIVKSAILICGPQSTRKRTIFFHKMKNIQF